MIDKFVDEYRFLSNFSPSDIRVGEVTFPTVEHAYQASKNPSDEHWAAILACETAGDAKHVGWRTRLRPDWDDTKNPLMLGFLRQKFQRGTTLAAKLLETGSSELVEGNYWHDTWWGRCNGSCNKGPHGPTGESHLGKMLMQIREELREERE